jgi:hypothetical protein
MSEAVKTTSVSELKGNKLKGFEWFNLKAKAKIWPSSS